MQERKRETVIAAVAVALLTAALIGPVVWNGEVLAFRDTANFYYPLFEWESREWAAGRIPLWNPYDNLGTPVLADGTSSVLYPGKLVFCVPLPFAARFHLYIAGHLLLAAATAFAAARHWRCSVWAAGVGALSYAFGGHVLAQHANVVYLVGAAWLPLAIRLAETMLVERSVRHAMAWGATVAMIILGGDLQGAYHAGLLAVLQGIVIAWRRRRWRWQRWTTSRPAILILAVVCAAGFSAVQILPSWEWTRRSDRVRYDAPRSLYESAEMLLRTRSEDAGGQTPAKTVVGGLFGTPGRGTHSERTYYYSVGPWRWVEFFWPNIFGRMYPIHRRWISRLPAEGGVWSPTLYAGVVALFAAAAVFFYRTSPRERWACWLVVLGLAGSMGWFGAGWLVHEIRCAVLEQPPDQAWMGQPVGGLYWLMVVLLPAYSCFRYPAKWFVFASLGISLLAARGVDRWSEENPRGRRGAAYFGLLSLGMLAVSLVAAGPIVRWFHGAPRSDLFGPVDALGAWSDLNRSLIHAASVATCLLMVRRFSAVQRIANRGAWIFLIAAVDLFLANRWLVATAAPASAVLGLSLPDEPPVRVAHARVSEWIPSEWSKVRDPRRFDSVLEWESQSLLRKYHLMGETGAVDSIPSIQAAEVRAFLNLIEDPRIDNAFRSRLLGRVDVGRIVRPGRSAASPTMLERNPELVYPRAWIARQLRTLETPRGASLQDIDAAMHTMWRNFLDSGNEIYVDPVAAPAETRAIHASRRVFSGEDVCSILHYGPQCIELDVSIAEPGMLVISDLYDPGWITAVRSHGVDGVAAWPVVRVNGLMRGVWLPAGKHRVVMRYHPRMFALGAWITGASIWAACTFLAYRLARRLIRRPRAPSAA